ncbi:MAG TPA: serine hydrolase domain-containing protein [Gemmatirosa sp.]|nr:serine hydrolase domain-containing protein [Gemmatirosa sp.]
MFRPRKHGRLAPRAVLLPTALSLLAACGAPRAIGGRPGAAPAGPSAAAVYVTRAVPFGWAGAVLVMRGDRLEASVGAGVADPVTGTSVAPGTVFDVASIAKQFTAAAILALQDDGRLRVTDSLSRFYPRAQGPMRHVTLHQLLTHTAGLELDDLREEPGVTRDSLERYVLAAPGPQAPGAPVMYSNVGYGLLAAVVERASGMPFEHYLERRLFARAGLRHTGMVRPDWRRATLAHGIVDGADRGEPTRATHWLPDGPSWAVRGSGGMLSTVEDLARWTRALATGTVLSASALRAATTAHAPLPPNPLGITGVGYGWLLGSDAHGEVRLVEGADRIFFSELRWYPARDVVVAFATNTPATGSWRGEEAMRLVARAVADVTMGGAVELPPAGTVTLARETLARYAGRYRLAGGSEWLLTVDGDARLLVEPTGQDAVNLLLRADTATAARLAAATARAAALLDALAAGDTLPLARSSAPGALARNRQAIARQLSAGARAFGAPRGTSVVGTVPAWWAGDGTVATFVRLRFERGERIFRIHWRGDTVAAFGGGAIPAPARVAYAPLAGDRFAGFHPVHPVARTLTFERAADGTRTLVLDGVRAARTPADP